MKDLILMGKQGSGKGTQAEILAKRYGFEILETGEALRTLAEEKSPLGREISEAQERGDLVSTEVVMKIVLDTLSKVEENVPVIFDGIPRSEGQRIEFEKLLAENKREFHALEIWISDEEAIDRVLIRAKCNDCQKNFGSREDLCPDCGSRDIFRRTDDTPTSIRHRLDIFQKKTAPLVAAWKKQGKFDTVDGGGDPRDVTERMIETLEL